MIVTVSPVNRERLHDRITRDLALNIIRGDLGAHKGAVFTETDIARQMNVSRTALRESVKVLAAKGLLSLRPKTGLRVCPRENWNLLDPELLAWLCETGIDDVLIRDLCEVRLLIEPAAAELAAARATRKEIEGILACYHQMQQNSQNASIYDPLDIDFHTRIFRSCHNAFITNMHAMMVETLRATQNVARRVHNVVIDQSWPLHGDVAKAIQERDCATARLSMERIVRQAARDISLSLNVKVAQFTDVTFKGGTPLVAAFQPNGSASKPSGLSGLQPQEREEKRTDAVRLVESGVSPEQVAKELGINRTIIYDWLNRYRVAGPAGLRSKISFGRPSKLTSAQRESIIAKLEGYSPSLIGSSSPLWTDASVRDLLRIEFRTNLSLSSVRRFLVSLGLRPKKFLSQFRVHSSVAYRGIPENFGTKQEAWRRDTFRGVSGSSLASFSRPR